MFTSTTHRYMICLSLFLLICVPALDGFAGTVQYRYDRLNRVTGAVSEEGMVFEYEYDSIGNRVSHTLTGGRTLYTITATAGEHGTVSPAGAVMVGEGMDQTFFIMPEAGYYLAHVLVDGASVGTRYAYTFSNVNGPHTIEAVFIEMPPVTQYTLIVEKSGSGTGTVLADGIDCGTICQHTYNSDTGLILNAIPDPGSVLVGWEVNGTPSGCLVLINGPTTVTARFELEQP